MNQTKKRLRIIKLAISITDVETIQLQVLKLNLLKTDQNVQAILSLLREQNYVQAQRHISEYLEAPSQSIIQRSSEEAPKKETAILKNNFIIEDIVPISPDETLYNQEEIPVHNTKLFTLIEKIEEAKESKQKIVNYHTMLNEKPETAKDTLVKEGDNFFYDEESLISNDIEETSYSETQQSYAPIPTIEAKLAQITQEYPPVHSSDESFDSVIHLLDKLKNEPYEESDIEKVVKYLDSIQHHDKIQATQLLLIAACTESTYAHFRLARALYKGDLVQQNLSEAFITINYLAAQIHYPEAICDLGQFYENGIGVGEDQKKALSLYKEAMSMGIQRATKHYDRLEKKLKGFLSFLN